MVFEVDGTFVLSGRLGWVLGRLGWVLWPLGCVLGLDQTKLNWAVTQLKSNLVDLKLTFESSVHGHIYLRILVTNLRENIFILQSFCYFVMLPSFT